MTLPSRHAEKPCDVRRRGHWADDILHERRPPPLHRRQEDGPRTTARSRAQYPPAALRPNLRSVCPNSPRSVIASPCPKQRASTARTAPQSTSLFAPRRDRHQTTRLNVADVARRFRAAKASSFLSIFSLVADGPKPRRRAAGKGPPQTHYEARRIAVKIAKLPQGAAAEATGARKQEIGAA